MTRFAPFAVLLLLACSGGVAPEGDGGLADSGAADSGTADSGAADSGVGDSGVGDSGVGDSGVADSGVADAGVADAGAADGGAGFVFEVSTELDGEGRLVFRSNVPRLAVDCVDFGPAGAPCEDVDIDALTDAWEDALLERLVPEVVWDELEKAVDDAGAVFAAVGRVASVTGDPQRTRAYMMLGYSQDYGCVGITAHKGDSERVVVDVMPALGGGLGDVVMVQAYTAAHECTITDHGAIYSDADLAQLELDSSATGEPRWVVYGSRDKHATYITQAVCDATFVGCLERCGPDGVADDGPFRQVPPIVNAGEPGAPRVTDLGPIGFPGDDAWADQGFCGGQTPRTGCPGSVASKLTRAPGECG